MKFNYNSGDEEDILLYAFRYALGRSTFASRTMTQAITKNWHELSSNSKRLIKREIAAYKQEFGKIGDANIDEPEWLKILDLE